MSDVAPRCELARSAGEAGCGGGRRPTEEGRNPLQDHCITCGDIAVPMTVVRVDDGLARCSGREGEETVEIALVGDVVPGDELLVHAGTALVRL